VINYHRSREKSSIGWWVAQVKRSPILSNRQRHCSDELRRYKRQIIGGRQNRRRRYRRISSQEGVNFINVFTYEFFYTNVVLAAFSSYVLAAFSSYVLALAKKFVQKTREKRWWNWRKENGVTIDDLNDDCLLSIFDQFTFGYSINFERVCTRWRQLLRSRWRTLERWGLRPCILSFFLLRPYRNNYRNWQLKQNDYQLNFAINPN